MAGLPRDTALGGPSKLSDKLVVILVTLCRLFTFLDIGNDIDVPGRLRKERTGAPPTGSRDAAVVNREKAVV
jgi:hypothetical protein